MKTLPQGSRSILSQTYKTAQCCGVGFFLLIAVSMFITTGKVAAQQRDWLWASGGGGGGIEQGNAVTVDAAGNTYITGTFGGSFTLGTIPLTNNGSGDVLTAKYDVEGNVVWAVSAGGSLYDEGRGIAVDAAGNSYVTGYFTSSSITFGATTLTNAGSGTEDVFIVKYNPTGSVVWAKRFGGTDHDYSYGIAADAGGSSYITGSFLSASITIGSTTLTNASSGSGDVFTAKYDPSGNVVWAVRAGGTGSDGASGIAIDAAGKCYVAGSYFSSTITFGGLVFANSGTQNTFVVEYDGGGGVYNAVGSDGVNVSSTAVCTDASGNFYTTGKYSSGTVYFGSTPLTNTGSNDVYIVKYNSLGGVAWARGAGGTQNDIGYGIAVDNAGNSYLSGFFASNSITFGSSTLNHLGAISNFIVKYDPAGNDVWATTAGGTGGAVGVGIAVDATGNCHATGYIESSGVTFGSNLLLIGGGWDLFVGVYGEPFSLSAVKDVPNDQGGKVFVQWHRSPLDAKNVAAIWHYEVYYGTYPSASASQVGGPSDGAVSKKPDPSLVNGLPTLYWSLVGTVDAKFLDNYSFAAPTPADSGPQGDSRYYYKVRACTYSASTYWESNIDYGHSVDNLSPVVPAAASLSGISNGWIVLNWKKNRTDSDLHGYVIYRSTTESFVPGPSNKLVTVSDTSYTDKATNVGDTYYYRITAVDIHGNESDPTAQLSQKSLAVELAAFDGFVQSSGGVRLEWSTLSETDNYGFEIQRRPQGIAAFVTLPNSFVAGAGTTQEPQSYSFTDIHVAPGTYYYRIKQIDTRNNITYGSAIKIVYSATGVAEDGMPTAFEMNQNYPNPFNPTTNISYALPAQSYVSLKVYNMLGQVVANLVDGVLDAGFKTATVDMGRLSSGVYVYQLIAHETGNSTNSGFTKTAKMMLVR